MKRTLVYLIILCLGADVLMAEPIKLTLYPAKAPEPKNKYQLLLKDSERSDSDAVPLYNKAVQSLPKDFQKDQISQWVRGPLNELPQKQAQAMLQQLKSTLQLVQQAAKCKQCNWPDMESGEMPTDLGVYRHIADVVALQARLQIAQGKYDLAINNIQTGFTMSRQLVEDSTLVQGLLGIAVGGRMCGQIEAFIQSSEAPNLYWALQDLPKPLVDITKTIELEISNLKQYNIILRKQFEEQLKPAHERIRLLMNRLDRHLTALQCIETLRFYAASHNGKFPNQINDIDEVPVPNDPVTQKPFAYSRTGSKAVLEGPVPKGGTDRDAIRYELNLKE